MPGFPYITTWTAVILGSLLIYLMFRVVGERRSKKISLGDNNDKITQKRIRGHANAAEQIPMALILLGLVEFLLGQTQALTIAVILILGRFMHAAYFSFDGVHWRFRFFGMILTVLAQIMALLGLLSMLIRQM